VKDFRNNIAHDYFGIDADEVWSIIQEHLNSFYEDIKKVLEKA
jgi:uncharacterized protein with HEPN domain